MLNLNGARGQQIIEDDEPEVVSDAEFAELVMGNEVEVDQTLEPAASDIDATLADAELAPDQQEPELDEFDLAALAVTETAEELDMRAQAELEADNLKPDEILTDDERLINEYREVSGASLEEAIVWLTNKKQLDAQNASAPAVRPEAAGTPSSGPNSDDGIDPNDPEAAKQRQMGRGSALDAGLAGIGNLVKQVATGGIKGAESVVNAARRKMGNPVAGLTPEIARANYERKLHEDYEVGLRKLSRNSAAIAASSAAFNAAVEASSGGKRLAEIAKRNNQTLQALMTDVTTGKNQSPDAQFAMSQILQDPSVKKHQSEYLSASKHFEAAWGEIEPNLSKLTEMNSARIDPQLEAVRLKEAFEKQGKAVQPYEVPAAPSDLNAKSANSAEDIKNPMKVAWERVQDVAKAGLGFIQMIINKVVSAFGRKM